MASFRVRPRKKRVVGIPYVREELPLLLPPKDTVPMNGGRSYYVARQKRESKSDEITQSIVRSAPRKEKIGPISSCNSPSRKRTTKSGRSSKAIFLESNL